MKGSLSRLVLALNNVMLGQPATALENADIAGNSRHSLSLLGVDLQDQ